MGEEKVNLEQFLALMHNLQQKQSHSIVALCFHLTNIKKMPKKKKMLCNWGSSGSER
jgi:hypothetical protein